MQTVSFTYGVAFNSRLISCVGTRIDWDAATTGTRGPATAVAVEAELPQLPCPPGSEQPG